MDTWEVSTKDQVDTIAKMGWTPPTPLMFEGWRVEWTPSGPRHQSAKWEVRTAVTN